MARYSLELPETPEVQVTAPRPTPEEVQQFEQEQSGGRYSILMPSAQAAEMLAGQDQTGEKPPFMASVGRGMMDVGQGLKQSTLQAMEAGSTVGAGTQSPEAMISGATPAQQYTRDVGREISEYERAAGPDIDVGRLTGNIAASAPTALIPGMGAASLGPRMLASSVGGGIAGGAMFVPEGQSRASNVASGLLLGAVAPAAIEPIRKGIVNLISKFRSQPTVDVNQLTQGLEVELRSQGINFNALNQEVKQSLINDVTQTLQAGRVVDPAQLARKAEIEAVGGVPTRAALTRNPKDWQTEQNLRGITGVGEPLAARAQTNAQKLIDYVQGVREKTGATAKTSYEAGERAIGAVKQSFKESGDEVGDLYRAAREAFGGGTIIPMSKVNKPIIETLNDYRDVIPSPVVDRLKEFGIERIGNTKPTLDLTVDEAEKFIKLINKRYNPADLQQASALDALRNSFKEGLQGISSQSEAATGYDIARKAAAERFQKFAPKNLQGITQGKITPDRFVEQKILGGAIGDLKSLRTVMQSADPQAWKDSQGIVLDTLLMKATGATTPDDAIGRAFSGVKFAKALDSIEPERLRVLFDAGQIQALTTLKRAAKNLTEEVPFSDVNYSKTTAALANLLQKIGDTPLLGQLVSPILGIIKTGKDWTKDAAARKTVAEALIGSAGNQAQKLRLPIPDIKPVRFATPGLPAVLTQPSGGAND